MCRIMRLKSYDFSNKYKFWVFLEKNGIFWKTWIFKIRKVWKFAVECVSNDLSLKCVFRLECEVLLHKIGFFKFGKLRKFDEERVSLKKKRFHTSRRHLQQKWKAEHMPAEAGRLDEIIHMVNYNVFVKFNNLKAVVANKDIFRLYYVIVLYASPITHLWNTVWSWWPLKKSKCIIFVILQHIFYQPIRICGPQIFFECI